MKDRFHFFASSLLLKCSFFETNVVATNHNYNHLLPNYELNGPFSNFKNNNKQYSLRKKLPNIVINNQAARQYLSFLVYLYKFL